ncbi:MAG: hypothetical protein IPP06_07050 [Saprospiraceae bacterium]|nr:hypothetical protein [Candidatus Vicinibacter affinis]
MKLVAADHEYLAAHWIDKIVKRLKDIYGKAFTDGEYVAIHRIKTKYLKVNNRLPDMDTEIQFFFQDGFNYHDRRNLSLQLSEFL